MILHTQNSSAAVVERSLLVGDDIAGTTDVYVIFKSVGMRIDNHSELGLVVGLQADASLDELLIAGWRHWGVGISNMLRGAFAFALYDKKAGEIFCARDVFGLSPCYFSLNDRAFYLGSSCRTVRSLLPDQATDNLTMLADYISGMVLENDQTFFNEIDRLPPAHWMRIHNSSVIKQRYWSVKDTAKDVPCDDAPRQLRHLFDESVQNCYVSNKSILMLSGGLDSSAIAGSLHAKGVTGGDMNCLAMTFYETPNWHDDVHLSSVCKAFGISAEKLPSDNHDPLTDMEHWLSVMDGPYLPHGHSISFRLLPYAKSLGFSIVLTGHGGDEIISYGFGRLNELAKAGKWLSLWHESRAGARLYRDSRWPVFRQYLVHLPLVRAIRSIRSKLQRPSLRPTNGYLSAELATLIGPSRYVITRAGARRDHDERQIQEEALGSPLQPLSLEVFALCGEASGVECRSPFYHRELTEFSISLPSIWKLRDGFSRYVLRKAMDGDLPEQVLNRQDKFDFGENFIRGLLGNPKKLLDLTNPVDDDLKRLVNVEKLRDLHARIVGKETDLEIMDAFFIWRVAVLSMWMKIKQIDLPRPELLPLK